MFKANAVKATAASDNVYHYVKFGGWEWAERVLWEIGILGGKWEEI